MVSLLATALLTPVAYGFAPGVTANYFVRVGFDGYLPIMGGQEGKVQIDMGLKVDGLAAGSDGNARASNDITSFKLLYNGAEFPLTLENVKSYFPKTTVGFKPYGEIVSTDAPDVQLPVKLPGIDARRFPDVTYLPVQFPVEGVEEGKSWSYKKQFAGSDMTYTVTPTKVSDQQIELKLDLTQHFDTLEDSSSAVVSNESEAASRVSTDVTGGGTATFDRSRNLISVLAIKATADSKITNLKSKAETTRKLTTSLDVSLDKPLHAVAGGTGGGKGLLGLLQNKLPQSRPVQRALVATQLVHPTLRNWRSAIPVVRSAVDHVNVVGQNAVRRQADNLAVLSRQAAGRIPKLVDVDAVKHLGNTLRGVPSVIRSHAGPDYERVNRLAQQFIQDIFFNHPGAP